MPYYEGDLDGISGLDTMAIKLPVTSRDAMEKFDVPIVVAKGPKEWVEEQGEDPEEAYVAYGDSDTPIPDKDLTRTQKDILGIWKDQFGGRHEDFPDLEMNQYAKVGSATLTFKRLKGWRLTYYDLDEIEDPEVVDFDPESE